MDEEKENKWHAAINGKGEPVLYASWAETEPNLKVIFHGMHQAFTNKQDAERWLEKAFNTTDSPEHSQSSSSPGYNVPGSSRPGKRKSDQGQAPEPARRVERCGQWPPKREKVPPSGSATLKGSAGSWSKAEGQLAGMKSEQRIKTENLGQEGLSISQIKSALAVKSEPCLAVKSAPGLGVKSEPGSTVKTEPGSASMSMSSDSKGQDGPASQPSSSVKPDLGLSDSGALKATAHDTGKGKAKEEEDDDLWAQVGDLEPPKQMWLDPELSREQESVRRMVIDEGKSLFFTGGAGTGKSVLLRRIVRDLRRKFKDRIAVCAMTGIAAVNIGGQTLHSWAGIGLGNREGVALAKSIKGNKELKERWQRVRVLLIDEISMLDSMLFDKLCLVAESVRGAKRPFGGIQLVLCGDFFQLPPVVTDPQFYGDNDQRQQKKLIYKRQRATYESNYAFHAHQWPRCVPLIINLKRVFRQTEAEFVKILESARRAQLTPEAIRQFRALSRPIQYNDGIEPTELYPVKAQVRNSNTERLKTLSSPLRTFTAIENSTVFPWHMLKPGEARTQTYNKAMEHLDKHVMVPHELYLKKGAQVMLVKNMSNGLVNGSRGVVVGFRAIQSKQDVSDDMGVLLVVGADTAAGQPDSYKPEKPSAALEVVRPAAAGETSSRKDDAPVTTGVAWPVVKFSCGDMLVPPVEFEVEDHTGHVEARRTQVPLILAWSISIHKSQGQTLDRVKVDLGRAFERGQAYVALSRATHLAGIQVLNFHPSKVMVDERVIAWEKQTQGSPTVQDGEDSKSIERAQPARKDKDVSRLPNLAAMFKANAAPAAKPTSTRQQLVGRNRWGEGS